jgi:hypothetical protein
MQRVFALALSIALVVALSVQGAQATQMTIASSVAATAPMTGDCDDCPSSDQPGMALAMCGAHCAGMVALPCEGVVLENVGVIVSFNGAEPLPRGRADPPDPRPPRPAALR